MNSVGIDVSKGKSMIAVMRPGKETVIEPFEVGHTDNELIDLTEADITADGSTVSIESSLIKADSHIRAAIGETPWYCVDLYNSAGIPARPATVSDESGGQVPFRGYPDKTEKM